MAADPAATIPARRPLEALETRLGEAFGLSLRACAPEGVAARLRYRIQDRAFDGPDAYAEYLLHSGDRGAWEDLAETLTANESRMFGAPGDFTPLLDMVSNPGWAAARPGNGPFRCLSAGCGTGEEAYSLAIALAEARAHTPALAFEVIGADLSTRAVGRARRGAYPASRGEPIPPETRERYFTERDGEILAGAIRSRVRFARLNLCEPDSLLSLGAFDLILARDVLPSLTAEGRRAALANLARALRPGGVLLLGPGDSIGEADLGLRPVRWGERFAYEAPPDPDARSWRAGAAGEPSDPGLALVAHRSGLVRSWVRILLEQRGLLVEEAPNAIRALERAAVGRPPSLFLLERTLPPRGSSWVQEGLAALGITNPGSVVHLTPGAVSADGGPSTGLPLTRRSLDQVLEPAQP